MEKLAANYASFQISLTPDSITVAAPPHYSRTLERNEISRAEEPALGGGLYIRSTGRYRWLLIPRGLEGYSEIRNLLLLQGIPVNESRIPPNLEEFLFVIAFCSSLICDLYARSALMLKGNLIASAVLAVVGVVTIQRGWANYPRKWMAIAGCFLPLILAALAFYWGGFLAR
jgi:hypothetical protein